MHCLILGGTGEARRIAESLAARPGLSVILSLAGRTRDPLGVPFCAMRVGGFGGAEGLARYVRAEGIDLVIDATHPFARMISSNAEIATHEACVPLVILDRPPWQAVTGDRWLRVPDMAAAAALLAGRAPERVFLAIGRQEAGAFRGAPAHHYLIRSVEPVAAGDLPGAETLLARGPFAESDERRLMQERRITLVVAKNSGGAATYGKITAARALGLPVVLVDRPVRAAALASVEAVVAEVLTRAAHRTASGAKRGV